jgi:hypothetical protein
MRYISEAKKTVVKSFKSRLFSIDARSGIENWKHISNIVSIFFFIPSYSSPVNN